MNGAPAVVRGRSCSELDWTDMFAGAGGSSTGLVQSAGVRVRTAANHAPAAIAVHQANHVETDHAVVDLHQERPEFFPRTRFLWASPECTKWSQSNSTPLPAIEEGLFADPNADDAATRSRLLMFDVLRYAEHHRYEVMVIENVVDIAVQAKYATAWREWCRQLRALGYRFRVMSINSAHAQLFGDPAPQSRDRIYIVAWLPGSPALDLEQLVRPRAYCGRCARFVDASQSWKPGRTVGRYRQAYVYVHGECGTVVEPGWLPATAAIDPSLTGEPIGHRLRPKTRARIASGIAQYWLPHLSDPAPRDDEGGVLVVPVEGRDGKHSESGQLPMRTLTTRAETALVTRHYGIPGGDAARHTSPAGEVLRTVTCSGGNMSVTTPPRKTPFVAELRGGGSDARSVEEPLATITAGGHHHGLVLPYYSSERTEARTDSGPLGPLATRDRFGLITHPNDHPTGLGGASELIYLPRPRGPRKKVTPEALEAAELLVPECLFRMLQPPEAAAAQAFPRTYIWEVPDERGRPLSKRLWVRMIGNAVSPPVARDISGVITQAYEAAV